LEQSEGAIRQRPPSRAARGAPSFYSVCSLGSLHLPRRGYLLLFLSKKWFLRFTTWLISSTAWRLNSSPYLRAILLFFTVAFISPIPGNLAQRLNINSAVQIAWTHHAQKCMRLSDISLQGAPYVIWSKDAQIRSSVSVSAVFMARLAYKGVQTFS